MGGKRYGRGAGKVALTGVLTALSLVFLWISVFAPAGRLGLVAVAGVFPAGAVVSAGLGAGFFCYGATGLLGLILLPAKGGAVLYLIFFGLWPMIKSLMERLSSRVLEWAGKLIVFNLILSVCWFGLRSLFLPFLPPALEAGWMVYAAGNVAFIIYDLGFSKLISFYEVRIDRALRNGA